MYVNNDIQKPYIMVILKYYERMCENFELNKYLPPPSRNN